MDPPLPSLEAVCFAPTHTGAFSSGGDMRSTFARTGHVGIFGKYDTSLKGFKFYRDAQARLEQAAAEQGIDLTSFIRELCLERAYGADHLTKLHRRRILAVAGKSPECSD